MLLRELPDQNRPRERLDAHGPKALSDLELLALLLGSGSRSRDVLSLSRELLPLLDEHFANITPQILRKVTGIGMAKSSMLVAALEFARRRIRPLGVKIRQAVDVWPLVSHLSDRRQEHFLCITLNGAHEVIACRTVTIGLVNATQIHPREVFSDAITDRASAIIIAHNHPSGQLEPSSADRSITHTLRQAGDLLGISVLDHIIFSVTGIYSFVEREDW